MTSKSSPSSAELGPRYTGDYPFDDGDGWRRRAACRDTDPDLFFPTGTTGPALDQIEAAKAVCRLCDVRPKCLEFALQTNQEAGVWGGSSEEERRKLRKVWLTRRARGGF
jgi:WhiB family redox-sensing transcriptional regulator